jgi:hypothetical protein
MPRPLRFIPENALVESTTRTLQGRLLLKPSPELTLLILGIIGKAQSLYGMTIHAFVFLSTHAHFLLSPSNAGQLAKFMQFLFLDRLGSFSSRMHDTDEVARAGTALSGRAEVSSAGRQAWRGPCTYPLGWPRASASVLSCPRAREEPDRCIRTAHLTLP